MHEVSAAEIAVDFHAAFINTKKKRCGKAHLKLVNVQFPWFLP
jgi:hypothetical protein